MKHTQRWLPALLLFSLALAPVLRADDDTAARKAAADELIGVMQSERMLDRAADQMGQLADRINPPSRLNAANAADDTAFRESLRAQARTAFKEQLKWETMEPLFAQLYVDAFTTAELKQLTDFYKSPVGQKLIEKQPALAGQFGKIMQQKAREAIPVVTQQLVASLKKYRADHPTPTPATPAASPSPSASPTSSPVAQ